MQDFETEYSPKDLQSIVWQDAATERKIMAYQKRHTLRHLVLFGPVGTGKSSIAKLLPYAIEPTMQAADIKLLNASKDRSIAALNKVVEDFKSTWGHNNMGLRVMILDEAEGITPSAFQALRGVLDGLIGDMLLIFTTNDITKIPKAVKSRCTCVLIDHASEALWMPRANWIMEQEGYPIPAGKLLPIIESAKGDNREILQRLQETVIQMTEAGVPKSAPKSIAHNVVARITPQPQPSQSAEPDPT